MTQYRDSDDLHRRVNAQPPLQTITAFSRAVGLSASSLRQYGDSGLLAPADVAGRTGYRYYSLDQQQRAIWIRRLRDAGLPLEQIRAVFDSDAASAESILDVWIAETRDRASTAEALVVDLKLSLRALVDANPARRTTVRFDGLVLASAISQVTSASEDADGESDFDGVLLEIEPASVAVAATDRYVLLTRTNVPAIVEGHSARVRLESSAVVEWLRSRHEVELIVDVPTGRDPHRTAFIRFHDLQGAEFELGLRPDLFPSVHRILTAEPRTATRVLFSREEVLQLAEQSEERNVLLTAVDGSATLSSADLTVLGSVIGSLPPLDISGRALRLITAAAAGHELTCEVHGADQVLVWRSPAQPDFAGLVMPRSA